MSTAKTGTVAGVVGAAAVAVTLLLSGEPAPEQAQGGHDSMPVRSSYVVPANTIMLVKVYRGKKLAGIDTLRAIEDSSTLHVKSQLIRTK